METPQKNSFSVHPSVIKSIILEQSGDPCKAIAELVMNSIDAKATFVDITLNSRSFSVVDDGVGFHSRDDVLKYFGTFGTPRKEESTYGVFRLGRGQIFGIASSTWRSGPCELFVNLDGLNERTDVGYGLIDGLDQYVGCKITGDFFNPLHKDGVFLNAAHFDESLTQSLNKFLEISKKECNDLVGLLGGQSMPGINNKVLIRLFELFLLAPIPVRLNGVQISNIIQLIKQFTDENADYYNFEKKIYSVGAVFLNQGIHINTNRTYPVSCVINFKKKPSLNIARNSINKKCPIFTRVINQHYGMSLKGFLAKDAYYDGFKKNIVSALSCSGRELRGVFNSYSYFPRVYDEDMLDDIAKRISMNIISISGVKLSLYDFILELSGDQELLKAKYKRSSNYGLNEGAINHKKHMLSMKQEHIVVYGIGGEQSYLLNFFNNLDQLYGSIGVSTCLEDTFKSLEIADSSDQDYEETFVYKNNILSCGNYEEITYSLLERNASTHRLIVEVIQSLRYFLKKEFGEVVVSEPHILADDLPFDVRFMTCGKSFCSMDPNFKHMANVHFLGIHFIAIDLKNFKLSLQQLAIDEGMLCYSVASRLYQLLLNAYHRKDKPLNILHNLREKNEDFLFSNSGFREEISRLDQLMADHWRKEVIQKNNPKKNFMPAKMMLNTQKKFAPYKAFFDKEYQGLSADLEKTLTEILHVET